MLLVNGVELKIHETSWLSYLLRYGLTPIMFVDLLVFMSNMGKIGESGFNVEPVETIKTRFTDVAGMDELKEDLLVLSDMMKNPEYRKSGARVPRGVLLQGPPGNGKTLIARAFAGETGVNFIAVNACDFGSQFIGIGSSKIKKVFTEAKRNAPCVIFIDEIDSVGSKRGTASDAAGKEMNTILTSLLNQMDGFEQMDNVMVLAATNRAGDLDDALIRPGRFDRQLIVNYPDKSTRKEIFELYCKNKKIATDVDFDVLSIKTYGYSCSKIECIVNEATILATKEKHEEITMKDFEDAIIQMDIKGHVKKKYTQTDTEREIVAYHEAGHAVATYFSTSKEVASVTIRPTTSGAGGFTVTDNTDESSLCPIKDYRNELIMLYAGRAAEVKLKGSIENATAGASADIQQATKLATSYVSIEEGIDYSLFGETGIKKVLDLTQNLLTSVWEDTKILIDEKWEYVDLIAKELMKTEYISKEKFVELIENYQNSTSNTTNENTEVIE
jgi:cell division protease FtsH